MNGVTTEIIPAQVGSFVTIDSPGLNDPKDNLKEEKLWHKKSQFLNESPIGKKGVALFVVTIMIQESGRIKETSVKIIADLIKFLNLGQNSSQKTQPKIAVALTNFSKFEESEEIKDNQNPENDYSFQGNIVYLRNAVAKYLFTNQQFFS